MLQVHYQEHLSPLLCLPCVENSTPPASSFHLTSLHCSLRGDCSKTFALHLVLHVLLPLPWSLCNELWLSLIAIKHYHFWMTSIYNIAHMHTCIQQHWSPQRLLGMTYSNLLLQQWLRISYIYCTYWTTSQTGHYTLTGVFCTNII